METFKRLAAKALMTAGILGMLALVPVTPMTASEPQPAPAPEIPGTIKVCSGDQHFIFLKNQELRERGIHARYSTEIGSDGDWVYCLTYTP